MTVAYVQHTAEEIEVLFTFLAERYKESVTVALQEPPWAEGSVRKPAVLNLCKTPNYGKPEPGLTINRLS
jgi:hypothetical protein